MRTVAPVRFQDKTVVMGIVVMGIVVVRLVAKAPPLVVKPVAFVLVDAQRPHMDVLVSQQVVVVSLKNVVEQPMGLVMRIVVRSQNRTRTDSISEERNVVMVHVSQFVGMEVVLTKQTVAVFVLVKMMNPVAKARTSVVGHYQ